MGRRAGRKTDVGRAELSSAAECLVRAEATCRDGLSEELTLEDLREALRHLGAITGEFSTEELYDRIFSTFCIGK